MAISNPSGDFSKSLKGAERDAIETLEAVLNSALKASTKR